MAYVKSEGPDQGVNDRTWLGSDHNIRKTETLNASAFDGDVVLSGTPVQVQGGGGPNAGLLVPFDDGDLRGFVFSDTSLEHGNYPVAVVLHGHIVTENLPVDFDAPASSSFTFA